MTLLNIWRMIMKRKKNVLKKDQLEKINDFIFL